MLWVWRSGTQEVGVSEEEGKEQKCGGGTSKGSLGESEIALECKRTTLTRSQNKHGGMGNEGRSGDLCRVPWMRLQEYQNSGELGTRVPEQEATVAHVV